ncbi:MAG: M42 family metallopeptidase [Firmicutes bacterium]|jgi:putative aminopeptidase FrvX|nr:M42 family metallopeptidase [Bacillota bacterium]
MDIKQLFQDIASNSGVSGYEDQIADQIQEACPWVDEFRRDTLGNLIMLKKGKAQSDQKVPRVMLAAHMDEIGLIITKVEKEGFLRFSTIGGFDQRVLLGQEVTVHGKETYRGVIGAKPPHVQSPDEQRQAVKLEDLFIDIGFDSAEEVEGKVAVGDLATINQTSWNLQGSFMAGKAFDDRAGVAAMLECLKALDDLNFSAEVYAVATVQEEVGLRGAITSTYGIVPDVGIAIDVGFGDQPGLQEFQTIKLGGGPAIGLGPHVHPTLHKRMVEVAKEWKIPYSLDPSPYPGGTDAYAIQVTQAGIPTILLSIPLRYMHTPIETLDYNDVKLTGRLMAFFIAGLDNEFVEGLKCF